MKNKKLQFLIKELAKAPKYKCKKDCYECCTAIKILPEEEKKMRKELLKKGIKTPPNGKGENYCEYLDENGKCSVYNVRPIICRLFGHLTIKKGDIILPTCTYAETAYAVKSRELEEYLEKTLKGKRNQVVGKGLKELYNPILSEEITKNLKKMFKGV